MKPNGSNPFPLSATLKNSTPIVIRPAAPRDPDGLTRLDQELLAEGLWTLHGPGARGSSV